MLLGLVLKNLSENITVKSIVDRFLEHSRIYCFRSTRQNKVFLASADWMTRCMDRRVEVMFPILEEKIKERIIGQIFSIYWDDNVKTRILGTDGLYERTQISKDERELRAQNILIQHVRKDGIQSIPYDKAIRFDKKVKGNRPVSFAYKNSIQKKGF